MSGTLELSSDALRVDLDPGRGCDILSVVDARTGIDVLYSTPWRERAGAIRAGEQAPLSADSVDSWMEQYRGGWQTLCPNAGPPRAYDGATLGFHGEASVVPWTVLRSDAASASLRIELFTVPLVIERTVVVEGSSLQLVDVLTNTSAAPIVVDYSNHPAFGGAFLDAACTVDTNASTFVTDPDFGGGELPWPSGLDALPGPATSSGRFGWLTGFPGEGPAWASITNPALDLSARLSWDPQRLPYAWWWQEFNASQGFPWFGRARVFAIEPASTQTSGPDRASVTEIAANGSVRIPVRLGLERASSQSMQRTEHDSE